MMPAMAQRSPRRCSTSASPRSTAFAETTALNRVEIRDTALGIVCAGVYYEHVREALPDASVLKLGMTFPLPADATARVRRRRSIASSWSRRPTTYLARSLALLGIAVADLDAAARRRAVARARSAGRSACRSPRCARQRLAAAAPAAHVPGLPASAGLRRASASCRAVVTGRHRLLHARRAQAARCDGHLRGHGRFDRHGARRRDRRRGRGAAGGGGHRRLDVRALGHHRSHEHASTTAAPGRSRSSTTASPR